MRFILMAALVAASFFVAPNVTAANQINQVKRVTVAPKPAPPAARYASSPFLDALGQWATDDLNGAIALSTSIPDMPDSDGKACWTTLMGAATVIKQHPLPLTLRLATDLEAGRLVAMALKRVCQDKSCTQMWQDMKNQINALAPIPLPFSMADICAKVP